jgi:hypothetical protein
MAHKRPGKHQNGHEYTHGQSSGHYDYSQDSSPEYSNTNGFKVQMTTDQYQKPISSQKEKQAMVNHLLGKLLSHVELILNRQEALVPIVYGEYLSSAAYQSSTVDLLRNCKQFVAALWINSNESDLLVNAVKTKGTAYSIDCLYKAADSLYVHNQESAVAKKVLLKVIGELRQGYVEPFTPGLSNEIYSHDVRDRNAQTFTSERQDEALQMITKVQNSMKKMTQQIEQIPDDKNNFGPHPQIHLDEKDLKVDINCSSNSKRSSGFSPF